jgi:DNA-binding response OmpR family regulator
MIPGREQSVASRADLRTAIVAASDLDWRNQFRQTLPECDLQPLMVRTSPEAVELAYSVVARLVILDMRVALRESMQACFSIRHIPTYVSTPIIMLINDIDPVTLAAGRQAGTSRFVTLPTSIFAMKQEIMMVLGAARQEPAAIAEWKPRSEPSPAFGETQAFVDGRNLLDVYRRAGAARILRRVTVHR